MVGKNSVNLLWIQHILVLTFNNRAQTQKSAARVKKKKGKKEERLAILNKKLKFEITITFRKDNSVRLQQKLWFVDPLWKLG